MAMWSTLTPLLAGAVSLLVFTSATINQVNVAADQVGRPSTTLQQAVQNPDLLAYRGSGRREVFEVA